MGNETRPSRIVIALILATALGVPWFALPINAEDTTFPVYQIEIALESDLTAANGVRSGSGTVDDPFVIEGWTLDDPRASISIRNTESHIVLRDVSVLSNGVVKAIELRFVHNVVVENVSVNTTAYDRGTNRVLASVELFQVYDVTMRDNEIISDSVGMRVIYPTNVTLESNVLTGGPFDFVVQSSGDDFRHIRGSETNEVNGGPLIILAACNNTTLADQTVGQLFVSQCQDLLISNITGGEVPPPMWFFEVENLTVNNSNSSHIWLQASDTTVASCRIDGPLGLQVRGSGIAIRDTTVSGGGGIDVEGAVGLSIERSQVENASSAAISLSYVTDAQVSNGTFTSQGQDGVLAVGMVNFSLSDNTVGSAGRSGIGVTTSERVTLQNNVVVSGSSAILVVSVENITLLSNTVEGFPRYGVWARSVVGLTMMGNYLGVRGLQLEGDRLEHFAGHAIDETNYLDGGPVRYYSGCDGLDVSGIAAGQLILANCTEASVNDLEIDGAATPVLAAYLVNTTLTNLTLNGNDTTLNAYAIDGLDIADSTMRGGSYCLNVDSAIYVSVARSTFDGCMLGILFSETWESRIESNNIGPQVLYGVYLSNTLHTHLVANSMEGAGVRIQGQYLQAYTTMEITRDNTLDGLPIEFHKNETGTRIGAGLVGQFIAVNCTDMVVSNLEVRGGSPGGLIAFANGTRIAESSFSGSSFVGLLISDSDQVVLSNVTATENGRNPESWTATGTGLHMERSSALVDGGRFADNGREGIHVSKPLDVTIRGAVLDGNAYFGAQIRTGSSEVSIENVVVSNNADGLSITTGPRGSAFLRNSSIVDNVQEGVSAGGAGRLVVEFTTFERNNRTGLHSSANEIHLDGNLFASNGVGLNVSRATGPGSIAYNVFEENEVGAHVRQAPTTTIYHNQFLENGVQARTDVFTRNWHAGYPEGGNYWSDFDGLDECTSPTQDICPIPDGLGDTPYAILDNSDDPDRVSVFDSYPLMAPRIRLAEPDPNAGRPDDVPELLDFLTTMPGALLFLLAVPATAAGVMWARIRQQRRP